MEVEEREGQKLVANVLEELCDQVMKHCHRSISTENNGNKIFDEKEITKCVQETLSFIVEQCSLGPNLELAVDIENKKIKTTWNIFIDEDRNNKDQYFEIMKTKAATVSHGMSEVFAKENSYAEDEFDFTCNKIDDFSENKYMDHQNINEEHLDAKEARLEEEVTMQHMINEDTKSEDQTNVLDQDDCTSRLYQEAEPHKLDQINDNFEIQAAMQYQTPMDEKQEDLRDKKMCEQSVEHHFPRQNEIEYALVEAVEPASQENLIQDQLCEQCSSQGKHSQDAVQDKVSEHSINNGKEMTSLESIQEHASEQCIKHSCKYQETCVLEWTSQPKDSLQNEPQDQSTVFTIEQDQTSQQNEHDCLSKQTIVQNQSSKENEHDFDETIQDQKSKQDLYLTSEQFVEKHQTPKNDLHLTSEQPVEKDLHLTSEQSVEKDLHLTSEQPVEQDLHLTSEKPFQQYQTCEQDLCLTSEQPVEQELCLTSEQPVEQDQTCEQELCLTSEQPFEQDQTSEQDQCLTSGQPVEQELCLTSKQTVEQDKTSEQDQCLTPEQPVEQELCFTSEQPIEQDQTNEHDQCLTSEQPVEQDLHLTSEQFVVQELHLTSEKPFQQYQTCEPDLCLTSEQPVEQELCLTSEQSVEQDKTSEQELCLTSKQPVEQDQTSEQDQCLTPEQPVEQELCLTSEQPVEQDQTSEQDQCLTSEQPVEQEQTSEQDKCLTSEQPFEQELCLTSEQPVEQDQTSEQVKCLASEQPVEQNQTCEQDQCLTSEQSDQICQEIVVQADNSFKYGSFSQTNEQSVELNETSKEKKEKDFVQTSNLKNQINTESVQDQRDEETTMQGPVLENLLLQDQIFPQSIKHDKRLEQTLFLENTLYETTAVQGEVNGECNTDKHLVEKMVEGTEFSTPQGELQNAQLSLINKKDERMHSQYQHVHHYYGENMSCEPKRIYVDAKDTKLPSDEPDVKRKCIDFQSSAYVDDQAVPSVETADHLLKPDEASLYNCCGVLKPSKKDSFEANEMCINDSVVDNEHTGIPVVKNEHDLPDQEILPREGGAFKWKYVPSFETDAVSPKKDDQDPCAQLIRVVSLPICRKPRRIGLSKKQRIQHLHPNFKH